MTAVLYAIPGSGPCATVERALQLKGLPYRRVELVPPAHRAVQRLRFGSRTVPGVALEDGARVVGSRPILRALEARVPAPPLLPADDDARARVERAEEWGDQVLQPLVRRILWAALRRAPGALPSYTEGARLPVPRPLVRAGAPLVARASQALNHATDLNVRADLAHLDGHLARVERWIEDGTLGGPAPNAADLQIAANLRLLGTIEDLRPALDARRTGELARRWFPRYPGHVPAGALPADWPATASGGAARRT